MNPTLQTAIPHGAFHPSHSKNRRNGKIARLPKPTRDMINRMLDDGLPAVVIIDELGEAGHGLNPQNLTNWVQGGYQDYLKEQQSIERAKAQMEFAIELLSETGDTDPDQIHRATNLVAAHQLFDAIFQHGGQAVRQMLKDKPQTYFTVINTLCSLSNSALRVERNRLNGKTLPPSSSISPNLSLSSGEPPQTPLPDFPQAKSR